MSDKQMLNAYEFWEKRMEPNNADKNFIPPSWAIVFAERYAEHALRAASKPPAVKWVKATDYKPKGESEYRPYRLKTEWGYDYGEIYVTTDEGDIFFDIDHETEYEPQSSDRWNGFEILDESDESPTAAGDILLIDRDWLHEILIEHIMIYKRNPLGVDANDVAEYLDDKLKGKGVNYVLDENERLTAAGDKLPNDVVEKILKVRDYLALDDRHEAYHHLYSIASPKFDSYHPWREMEEQVGYQKKYEAELNAMKATAAGDGKEAMEFSEWMQKNTVEYRAYDHQWYCCIDSEWHTTAQLYDIFKNRTGARIPEIQYRGPASHCKACEDEAAGIKHITAAKHTCRKHQNK